MVDDLVLINSTPQPNAEAAEKPEAAPKAADSNPAPEQPAGTAKKAIRNRKKNKKRKNEEVKVPDSGQMELSSPTANKNTMSEEKKRPEYSLAVENLMTQSQDSLDHHQQKLDQLIEQDARIKVQEMELLKTAKKMFIDEYTDSSKVSQLSSMQKQDLDRYKAERTSLLHGEIQLDKYPEAHNETNKRDVNQLNEEIDSIGKELSMDEDIKMFQAKEGVRKRTGMEI